MIQQSAIGNQQSAIKASAPGSLMLLGEHAVLHGRRALVCAIDQRISVESFQCSENVLRIDSVLGQYESPLDQLEDHPHFRFVLDAVKQYPLDPSFAKGYGGHGQGIELKITADFSSDIGFGSSAAVTVATHAALMKFVGQASLYSESLCPTLVPGYGKRVLQEIFTRSLATVHRVQGRGSGADVAASVFGGVVAYRAEPLEIQQVDADVQNVEQASRLLSVSGSSAVGGKRAGRSFYFPLTAVYSGSKMKTADVIKIVEDQRKSDPEKYDRIFDQMDASVSGVVDDFELLGKKLVENQFLMEEMGLCNDALAEIIGIFQTLQIPAKISGSGLGDCAIGLGRISAVGDFPTYALNVTTQGVAFAD